MTITEFNDYFKSFNKNSGEFTKDEVYELGKAFKQVIGKKRWQYLADLVGWNNGERLRSYIKSRLYKDGLMESQLETALNADTDVLTTEETKDSIDVKLATLYKEQTKYRDIMNQYRRYLRDDARIEVLKDTIKSCVNELNELPKFDYYNCFEAENKKEAVLLFSDLHLGVECDNYYNKYNTEIAKESLNTLADEVIKYCELNKVSRLNVLNLGDLIQGDIHITARLQQETDVISQVMTAAELTSQFLNKIQNAANEVIYRSVSDNHARVVANLSEHLEKENFGRLIDWFLEERLKDTNIKFMLDNIDESVGVFNLLNGKLAVFVHGHLDNKKTTVQDLTGLLRQVPDYVFWGHLHKTEQLSFQGSKVYVNGSIVGTEQYAFNKRLFSKPEQKLLIFDDKATIDINIQVRE